MTTNKSPEKLGRGHDAPTNVAPQIIRTREELATLDPDTILISTVETQYPFAAEEPQEILARGRRVGIGWIPAVVIATGDQVRAARQALEARNAAN